MRPNFPVRTLTHVLLTPVSHCDLNYSRVLPDLIFVFASAMLTTLHRNQEKFIILLQRLPKSLFFLFSFFLMLLLIPAFGATLSRSFSVFDFRWPHSFFAICRLFPLKIYQLNIVFGDWNSFLVCVQCHKSSTVNTAFQLPLTVFDATQSIKNLAADFSSDFALTAQ